MGINMLAIFISFAVICSVASFSIKPANFRQQVTTSKTQLFEVSLEIMYSLTDRSLMISLFILIKMEYIAMIDKSFHLFLFLASNKCFDGF
jgi:hypothetical protein